MKKIWKEKKKILNHKDQTPEEHNQGRQQERKVAKNNKKGGK